jgi:hypothetical protein
MILHGHANPTSFSPGEINDLKALSLVRAEEAELKTKFYGLGVNTAAVWLHNKELIMKMVTKMFVITVIAAVIVFSMTACSVDQKKQAEETQYAGVMLNVPNEQVWNLIDGYTISDAYEKSTLTSGVSIVTLTGDEISTGEIKGGVLTFSVTEPEADNLLVWDVLKALFNDWNDVTIDDLDAKGNVITVNIDAGGRLNREKLYGTNTLLGLESIIYIFVNKNCRITGEYKDGSYWYTAGILDLPLKRGWNLLCRREFLDMSGEDAVSMEMKQPVDFRWAIRP